jgi:hypothetical protein
MVGLRGASALVALALALAASLIALSPGHARASSRQISIVQDDPRLDFDPIGTLDRLRLLGAQAVRVSVTWRSIAPSPGARHAPRGFDASDPGAYPPANWRLWDTIVTHAHAIGIGLDFDLMGGAPQWALGRGRPRGNSNPSWEPSFRAFNAFVRAVGTRYSGQYVPAGDTAALPRVDFWSIWNEPDYGPSLAPQGVPGDRRIENSPRMYRNLLGAGWKGLEATGHGPSTDTILFGELAPRGEARWGIFSGMTPLTFLRALYCVDSRYHRLRGASARIRGCPTTRVGSHRFRAQHPALFKASGVSDHPYMRWYAPNHELDPDPTNHLPTTEYASLAVLGHLTRALDRLVRVYGAHRRFPIYNTEFGYITAPPKHSPDPTTRARVLYVPPTTAAAYTNWAEYISWRNPRLRSFDQYLLYDPLRPTRANNWGGFASGVLTWNGVEKPTYDAWRLPLYLPVRTARGGRALEVWGCVRPALYGLLDGQPQSAEIQFAPGSSGDYATLATVTVGDGDSCYFDMRMRFPSSGTVRLAYTYPAGGPAPAGETQVYSRVVAVKAR